jgi:hypothetical protein
MHRGAFIAAFLLSSAGSAAAQTAEPRPVPLYARVYVIAVCAASEEVTNDCIDQGLSLASYALADMYVRAYRGQPLWNTLRVRFPYGWAEASQRRFLLDLERRAIASAKDQMEGPAADLGPERSERRASINIWHDHALMALDGRNWSHEWAENKHDFSPAQILKTFAQASVQAHGGP